MHLIDLCDRDDPEKLCPLSLFRVHSVMLHPNPSDTRARERFMAKVAQETGAAKPRRAPLGGTQAFEELLYYHGRGAAAGQMLLTLIQLHQNKHHLSLETAIRVVQHLLPESESPELWRPEAAHEHLPRSRRRLQQCFRDYRWSVHLWAAYVHALEWGRNDIWPGASLTDTGSRSVDDVATFIGYAEALAELYREVPLKRTQTTPQTVYIERWRFKIPDRLTVRPRIEVLPIPDEWEAVITSR